MNPIVILLIVPLAVATPAGASALPPSQSGPDLASEAFDVLCTATPAGLSTDRRFYAGIADPTERLKAGAVLAYLDAHPFPLDGDDAGADVKTRVALQVTPSNNKSGFDVTAPNGVFHTSAESEINDPV